ncbi:MAG: septum site-determining protein MinC [Lachnospiraceae bacterium]|nr:septum site-determining protein MinC [Lachnospiraceae bacterium]
MKNSVIIKSYKDGIAVYLDNEMEFEQLLADVGDKFRDNARFFGDMRVAVSFEGRILSSREENLLVDAISCNSQLHVACIIGKDEEKEAQFTDAIEAFERYFPKAENDGRFYRGSLRDGQILETEGSIVIIGDVMPGCSVISTKDIIVLGKLQGSAYAGGNGSNDHFIAALEMTPQKLKIGDFKYKTKEKSRWLIRPKKESAQIAYVKDGKIQMQAITNESLNELT